MLLLFLAPLRYFSDSALDCRRGSSIHFSNQIAHVGLCVVTGVFFSMPFPIQNHKGRYLLKYEFTDTATGDVFFSTNWLEGGKQYSYRLDGLEGSVDSKVHIYAKDADTYGNVSGVNLYIKITKGE